jgi:hypothetical protein
LKLFDEAYPFCRSEEDAFIYIAQLYISNLPEETQNLFPESKRNSLIASQIYSECLS